MSNLVRHAKEELPEQGVYRKTWFDPKLSRIRPVTLLCRLGFHSWPEWRIDVEQTDTPDGFLNGKRYWSFCRVCKRCYKVDLKQQVETVRRELSQRLSKTDSQTERSQNAKSNNKRGK